MNRDIFNVGYAPGILREQAYAVITRTQRRPEVQVLAIALALVATCEALDIDIKQLLTSVERMKADLDGPFVHIFASLREYARNEIGRR